MRSTTIYETEAYLKAAAQYLTDHEMDAVRQLLAAKPMAGSYDHDLEVFALDWGRNPELKILYGISPALEVLLLHVGPKSDPPDSGLLKDVILATLKAGAIIAVKELWELLKRLGKDLL